MEKKYTAIIIDDMPDAISTLKRDIEDFCPQISLVGTAGGVVEGSLKIRKLNPEIIFLDIQMQDGDGFDLLDILGDHLNTRVIFTTASDAHAIKAFRYAASDYLLKPIDPEELQNAVTKVISREVQSSDQHNIAKDFLKKGDLPGKIALHTAEMINLVDIDQIIRLNSSNNYTLFYIEGQKKILVSRTLKDFETMLSPMGFLRVHQSHLININYIKAFVKTDGGYLVMTDGSKIPVASRKRAVVFDTMNNLNPGR